MRDIFSPFRFGATCLVALLLVVGSLVRAQTGNENSPARSHTPEKLSQAELLESYRQLREQLHAAELAIVSNRLEADAAASAQAAAITEKLDTLRSAMMAEREHQQAEAQQAAAERDRQQAAAQEMNRNILWLVVAFGGIGLLVMAAIAVLQWRGIKRMAELAPQLHALPAPAQPGWLPIGNGVGNGAPAGESVALSSARLLTMIDRMERRVLELELAVVPPPAAATAPAEPAEILRTPAQRPTSAAAQAERIATLLGQGRSLLNAKKPGEAVACYDEILSIDANHPEALVKKGSALERLKQDHEALECYDRAIGADQNMALAYLSKGGVCVRLQRFEEALECYERALQAGKAGNPGGVARVSVSADWPPKR